MNRSLSWLVVLLLLVGPVRAAELILFERADCPICLRWDREVAPIYPKTDEAARAPLRRVTLGSDPGVILREPVRYTPTFVLAVDGAERGRVTGYRDAATFWGLLNTMLAGGRTE